MRNEQLSKVERRQVLEFGLSIAGMDAHLAWDRLIKMLDCLGFRRCLYGFHPDVSRSRSTGEIIDIMTTMSSYDDAFMEMYWAHKKPFTSAVAGYVIMNEAPTLMGPFIGATLATPSLPTVFRDWLEDYNRRTHVFDGVVVPLRGPVFSARGGVSILVDPAPDPDTARAHALRHMALVAELVNAFHQNIEFSSLLPREMRLSAREREILGWLAQGLVTKQIADRTGTSPSTVEKQLSNARQRLAAGNNTNLLLKAMAYNLL